jgi:Ion channel
MFVIKISQSMPSDRAQKWVNFANNKYNRLLSCLLLFLICSPFFTNRGALGLLFQLIFLVVIVTAIHSFLNRQTLFLYLMLAGALFFARVFAWLNQFSLSSNLKIALAASAIDAVFIVLSINFIIGEIFSREIITVDAIRGGIVVYLLLGIVWFEIYRILNGLSPDSFPTDEDFELLHFSFTTLSTVGYGDIVPGSKFAKILANLEGMVGVLYPNIFIARLISLYEQNRSK